MVKQTATIVVCLLALSLAAFADRGAQNLGSRQVSGSADVVSNSNRVHANASWEGNGQLHRIGHGDPPGKHNDPPGKHSVPEPGSLLIFGTVMLMGVSTLRRKSGTC